MTITHAVLANRSTFKLTPDRIIGLAEGIALRSASLLAIPVCRSVQQSARIRAIRLAR